MNNKLLGSLIRDMQSKSSTEVLRQLMSEGLLNARELERRYIRREVEHRVRNGEMKTRAIEYLANEMGCSYEKARAAVYSKN